MLLVIYSIHNRHARCTLIGISVLVHSFHHLSLAVALQPTSLLFLQSSEDFLEVAKVLHYLSLEHGHALVPALNECHIIDYGHLFGWLQWELTTIEVGNSPNLTVEVLIIIVTFFTIHGRACFSLPRGNVFIIVSKGLRLFVLEYAVRVETFLDEGVRSIVAHYVLQWLCKSLLELSLYDWVIGYWWF